MGPEIPAPKFPFFEMNMKKFLIPIGLTAGVVVGWAGYAGLATKAYATNKIDIVPVAHAKYDPAKIDREIAFHEGRVQRDPDGAIGWAMLSGAYLAKSREQDDDQSSWQAEAAANKSMQVRRRGNIQGALKLPQALLEQHRFQDALKAAEDSLLISPGENQAKLLLADILVELGRISQAQDQLKSVDLPANDPSFLAMQARILGAEGKREKALSMWNRAIAELSRMGHISEDSLAWYHVKAGAELIHLGRLNEAKKQMEVALAFAPKNYKAVLGLAEVAYQMKDWKTAIIRADQTLTMVNSFRAMAIRGDALLNFGDNKGAQAQFKQMQEAFLEEDFRYSKLKKGGPLGVRHPDREFASFCASHEIFIQDGLRAAERDFLNRPDELAKSNLAKLTGLVVNGKS